MRNIFGWLGQQEQHKALTEGKDHLEKVRETVHRLRDLVRAVMSGENDKVMPLYEAATAAEHEADIIRRRMLERLSEGLFLPPDREDLVHFTERMDDIADYATAAARLLILIDDEQLPEPLRESLLREADLLTQAVDTLGEALGHLHRGEMKEALDRCTEVEELEQAADREKAKLLRHIFKELHLEPRLLLLVHDLIEALENTADMTEDTADQIRIIAVKYRG